MSTSVSSASPSPVLTPTATEALVCFLLPLVLQRKDLLARRDALSVEISALNVPILQALADAGLDSLKVVDQTVRVQTMTTKKINPQKLLELGVPLQTIEAATEETVSERFVRVDGPRQRKEK